MRKQLFFIPLIALLAMSCDDRFDFLEDLNRNPSIMIIKNGNDVSSLNDSLKTSLKTGQEFYEINVIVSDPELLLGALSYQVVEGNGTMFQNGSEVTTMQYDEDGRAEFSYKPSTNGINRIKLIITDNLGNKGEATINLLVFNNIRPVAVRALTRIGVSNPFEYDLDASASYDPDKNVGGGVDFYEWDINGTKFLSPNAVSRFIFPQAGTYEIKLRVRDNDGEFSEVVGGPLTLNN